MNKATVLGNAAHERAVANVQASYRARPTGAAIRLNKRTSNLFRPRGRPRAGLDVAELAGVINVDGELGTADVQGMCTYERLVETTLNYDLMPLVVPQLKTITLGGAVTGLGIESSSWRNGLPHESVLEMDILTGNGEVVTATPNEHSDLFYAFPNSYGSLGYAVRIRIQLEPVAPFVALQHIRFADLDALADAVRDIADTGRWAGSTVDFLDGVMFSPDESYLTLGRWADHGVPSDYTGQKIYYRSIRERNADCLTVRDYLWRWDTDWFWCSAAFGAQHALVRRVWPRRLRRSDVYHRIVAFDNRYGVGARIERLRGRADRERVVQDVEVPVDRTAEFLRWFVGVAGMSPVWLCPVRSQGVWPLYPLTAGQTYVNVGFWGTVAIPPGRRDGDLNRQIEAELPHFDAHKSLYSDVYYDRDTFGALYGGDALAAVRGSYDPDGRLATLFDKVVTQP